MAQEKLTLGEAIDRVVAALEPLEPETRKTVLQAACTHLNVILSSGAPSGIVSDAEGAGSLNSGEESGGTDRRTGKLTDVRSLKEAKRPNSARQMACIVAYYLQELAPTDKRKDTVTTQDLEVYFKQAGFKLPQKLDQVLPDAKRAGYFESGTRGEYRLNAVGYNLVVHNLPKQGVE